MERRERGHQTASIRLSRRWNPAQCSSHVHLADNRARDEVGAAARDDADAAARDDADDADAAARDDADDRARDDADDADAAARDNRARDDADAAARDEADDHARDEADDRTPGRLTPGRGRRAASRREAGPTAPATGLKVRPMGW